MTARTLAASGIEFHESELPRSFRPESDVTHVASPSDTEASPQETAVAVTALHSSVPASLFGAEIARLQRQDLSEAESPLASALGSWQTDLIAYKKKRQKTTSAL